jgi:hypothetical protein
MVSLIVLAVMAARETHAHADRDHASTLVHTHLAEAAPHFEAEHAGLRIETVNDHSSASYFGGLQLTNAGKSIVPSLTIETSAVFFDGRKSVLARMRSENAWAHAPPSLTLRSLRSPPSILLS